MWRCRQIRFYAVITVTKTQTWRFRVHHYKRKPSSLLDSRHKTHGRYRWSFTRTIRYRCFFSRSFLRSDRNPRRTFGPYPHTRTVFGTRAARSRKCDRTVSSRLRIRVLVEPSIVAKNRPTTQTILTVINASPATVCEADRWFANKSTGALHLWGKRSGPVRGICSGSVSPISVHDKSVCGSRVPGDLASDDVIGQRRDRVSSVAKRARASNYQCRRHESQIAIDGRTRHSVRVYFITQLYSYKFNKKAIKKTYRTSQKNRVATKL